MTRDEWERLSLDEKLAWYYDKIHTLVDSCKNLVDIYVQITTEDISSEAAGRVLRPSRSAPTIFYHIRFI
jgi:hypothetical protein